MRAVADERVYLEASAAGSIVAELSRARGRCRGTSAACPLTSDAAADDVARLPAALSGCELEVLHMLGNGQSTRAIAAVLHRSVNTIQTYRSRMRAKLRLTSPTALAQMAWRFVHPTTPAHLVEDVSALAAAAHEADQLRPGTFTRRNEHPSTDRNVPPCASR